jgi:hypothetical protein
MRLAEAGILSCRKPSHVDHHSEPEPVPSRERKTTFADAFAMADRCCIRGSRRDLMVKEGLINLDFADVPPSCVKWASDDGTGEHRAKSARRGPPKLRSAIRSRRRRCSAPPVC